MKMSTLYEKDFYQWTVETANAIKKENTIKERQYMCEMCFFLFHSSDNPTSVRCPVCVSDLVTKASD